jgi:hypothetical protein
MFEDVTRYAKAHPYQVGGLVLLSGVALYLLLGSDGGATDVVAVQSGQSESLQLAAMQMGNQLQLAQVQAGSARNVIAGQVEIEAMKFETQSFLGQLALAAQTAIAQMTTGVQLRNIEGQERIQLSNISAARDTSIHALNMGVRNTEIQSATAISLSEISAGTIETVVDALRPGPAAPPPLTMLEAAGAYLAANPDVANEYNSNRDFYRTIPEKDTALEFAYQHYIEYGAIEGRAWPR